MSCPCAQAWRARARSRPPSPAAATASPFACPADTAWYGFCILCCMRYEKVTWFFCRPCAVNTNIFCTTCLRAGASPGCACKPEPGGASFPGKTSPLPGVPDPPVHVTHHTLGSWPLSLPRALACLQFVHARLSVPQGGHTWFVHCCCMVSHCHAGVFTNDLTCQCCCWVFTDTLEPVKPLVFFGRWSSAFWARTVRRRSRARVWKHAAAALGQGRAWQTRALRKGLNRCPGSRLHLRSMGRQATSRRPDA